MNPCVASKRRAMDNLPFPPDIKRYSQEYVSPHVVMPSQMMYPFYPSAFFDPSMSAASSVDNSNFHGFMSSHPFLTPTPSECSVTSPSSVDIGIFDVPFSQPPSPNSPAEPPSQEPCVPSVELADDTVYCEVQGRLNLVGNLKSYPVTIGEIKRRIGYPENMNSSTISAVLRRSKVKSGTSNMREKLEKHGIHLSTNKRRGTAHLSFSAFCEGEVKQINKDVDAIVKHASPAPDVAKVWTERMKAKKGDEIVRREMEIVQEYMNEYCDILRENDSYVQLKEKMNYLSLITHGFYPSNLVTNANVVEESCKEALNLLDQIPVPPSQSFPNSAVFPWTNFPMQMM